MRKDGGNPKLEMGSEVGGTNGKEPKKVNVGPNTPAKLEICQNYSADIYSGLAVSKANVDLTEDEKKLITNLSTLAEETIEFGDEIVGEYDKYMEEGGQEDKLSPRLKQKFAELGNKIKKVNELIAELKATLAKKIAAKTQQDAQSGPANSVGSPQNQSTKKLQLQQVGESIGINRTDNTSTLSSESPSSGAGVGSGFGGYKSLWDAASRAAGDLGNYTVLSELSSIVSSKISDNMDLGSVGVVINKCAASYSFDLDLDAHGAFKDLAENCWRKGYTEDNFYADTRNAFSNAMKNYAKSDPGGGVQNFQDAWRLACKEVKGLSTSYVGLCKFCKLVGEDIWADDTPAAVANVMGCFVNTTGLNKKAQNSFNAIIQRLYGKGYGPKAFRFDVFRALTNAVENYIKANSDRKFLNYRHAWHEACKTVTSLHDYPNLYAFCVNVDKNITSSYDADEVATVIRNLIAEIELDNQTKQSFSKICNGLSGYNSSPDSFNYNVLCALRRAVQSYNPANKGRRTWGDAKSGWSEVMDAVDNLSSSTIAYNFATSVNSNLDSNSDRTEVSQILSNQSEIYGLTAVTSPRLHAMISKLDGDASYSYGSFCSDSKQVLNELVSLNTSTGQFRDYANAWNQACESVLGTAAFDDIKRFCNSVGNSMALGSKTDGKTVASYIAQFFDKNKCFVNNLGQFYSQAVTPFCERLRKGHYDKGGLAGFYKDVCTILRNMVQIYAEKTKKLNSQNRRALSTQSSSSSGQYVYDYEEDSYNTSNYESNSQSGDSNNGLAGGSQSGSDFGYGDDRSQSEEPSDISELQDPNGLITEKGKDSLRGIVKLVNGHFKGVEIDNDSRTLIMEGESNEIVNFLLKNSRGSMDEIGASIRGIIYDEINKKVGRNVIADDDDFLGNLMNQGVDYKKIEEKTGRKVNEIKENIDKLKLAFVVCLAKESNTIEGLVNEFTAPMKKVKKVEWDFTDVLWRMEDYYKRVLEFAGTKFAELLAQYSNAETGGIFKNLFKPGKNKSKDSATFDSKKMKNLVFNSVKYVICENIKKWAELTKNKNQGFEKGIDLIAINGMAKLTSPEMPKNVIDLLDQATSYFAGSPKDMGEFCANRGLGIRAGEAPPKEKPAFSWDLLWERCSEKLGSDGMPDKETMKKDFLRFTGGEGENDLKKLNLQDGERVEKLINDFIKAEADDLSCKDAAGGTLVICVPKDKTKIGKKGKKGKKGEILVSPLHIAWAVERFVEKVKEEGYKSEGMFKFLKTKNQVIAAHGRLEKLCKSGVFSRWLSQGVDSVKYVDLKNPKGIQHDLKDRARDAKVRLRVMVGTEEIGTFGSSRYQKIMKISPYSEAEQREQAVSYTWSRAYEQGGEYSGLDAVWHKGKHKAAVHSTRIEAFAVEIADFVNSKGEKYIEKKFSEKALKELRGDKKDETNKANKKLIRKQRDQRIDLFVRLANEIIDYRNKLGRKLEGYLKDTKINYSEFNSKQHGNAFSAYHESLQKLYEIWKLWLDAYHSEKGLLKFLDEKTYERLEKKGSYSYVSADGKEINKTVWEIPKDRITVEEIRKEPEKDEDEDYSESSANASRGSLETGKSQSEYYENSWGRSERKTGTESHYESNVSELTELSGKINDDSSKIENEYSEIPVTSRPSSGNMKREVPKKVSKDSGPRVNERAWGANDGASVNTVAGEARSFSSESLTMSGEQSPMTELEIAESKCEAAESAYRSLDEEIKKIKEDENLGNVEKKQKIQALETEYGSLKKLEKKHKETKKRYNQLKKKSGKNKKK